MSSESNPYEASSLVDRQPISFRQRFLPWAVGGIVVIASAFTMLAFLFGISIAFAGESEPSPLNTNVLMDGPLGKYYKVGLIGILPVSLMLGFYSMSRIAKTQRNLIEAAARRHDLQQQIELIRNSHKSQ